MTFKKENKFEYLLLDSRSLGLFRIVLGISVIYNLVFLKFSYAKEFYGAHPIIPQAVFQKFNGWNSYSVFDLIRNDQFTYVFIISGIIAACLFTIGYKTRITSWITLFFYWNLLQASSSYIFGFDFYTFQMLFWACFLPLGSYFAVSKNKQVIIPRPIICFVILYQVALIYFMTGLAKYGLSWKGGYAVRNMFMDLWAAKPLSGWIVDSPMIYKPMTYLTLIMELLFPVFIFVPFRKDILRYVGVLLLIGFHLSIFLTYDVANFSITGLAVAALLLPGSFWNFLKQVNSNYVPVKPNSKLASFQKYAMIIFVVFSFYVITEKNLIFLSKFSAWKNYPSSKSFQKTINKIDIPSPVKVSFFLQNWKMFAPNPQVKGGWLALEIKKEDGYDYDYLTNNLITDQPSIYWKPKGYEFYIMMYARNFDYERTGDKFKLFLKYWIPYKVKSQGDNISLISKLTFVDYAYPIADQSKPFYPKIYKVSYPAQKMVEYKYPSIRK